MPHQFRDSIGSFVGVEVTSDNLVSCVFKVFRLDIFLFLMHLHIIFVSIFARYPRLLQTLLKYFLPVEVGQVYHLL